MTHYGKENGLVVGPGKQYSGVEVVLHCGDKSQNGIHHPDGIQGSVEGRQEDLHAERGGWEMFERAVGEDLSWRCRAIL